MTQNVTWVNQSFYKLSLGLQAGTKNFRKQSGTSYVAPQ